MSALDQITRAAGQGLSNLINACIEGVGKLADAGMNKVTDSLTAGASSLMEGVEKVANSFTLGGGIGEHDAPKIEEPKLGANARKQEVLANQAPDRSEFAFSAADMPNPGIHIGQQARAAVQGLNL